MKKIILFISLISIPFFASAQFAKGDKSLGGFVTFSGQDDIHADGEQSSGSKRIGIEPSFAYFVNENTSIGILAGYSRYLWHAEQPDFGSTWEAKERSFSAGLFTKRYFPIVDNFLFTLNGQVKFTRNVTESRSESHGYLSEDKFHSYSLGAALRPGFTFFPSHRWAFEASIGSLNYTYSRGLSNDASGDSFGLDYGSIGLGVRYFFRQ